MVYEGSIIGQYVNLRSVTLEDAEFTLKIRQDKEKNKYLHQIDDNLEKQRAWISKQMGAPNDYFFLAETKKGIPVGTVGIYDIDGKRGHLGRLLMVGNPYQTFEATMLAAKWAYEVLGLGELNGDVHVDNKASLGISEAIGFRFGETEYDAELDRYFRWGVGYAEEFPQYEAKIKELIYRE